MSTPSAIAAAATPAPPSAAAREVRLVMALVAGVVAAGGALQMLIPPGPVALVAASAIAGAAILAASLVRPGRLGTTLAGFRFVSVLLLALAICAMLGTLILQGKSEALYWQKYGATFGGLIVALRLDAIFHSLWFAGLIALFAAAVIVSAVQRWPPRLKNAGFFACHVGLLTSLVGAALSTTLSVKGRVDLHAGGETATSVAVTRGGARTGHTAPLGFDLRLDRFDVVHYEAEYRLAFYEQDERGWRLRASFDPEVGVKHRLPGGDSFLVKSLDPSDTANPAVVVETARGGEKTESRLAARDGDAIAISQTSALAFERREQEVKAFRSSVTAMRGSEQRRALVSVNDPFAFGGWTFYQANYNPDDPTYSGLDAVRDPGVAWVFVGFALIAAGVFTMFYVETRLRRRVA